MVRRLMVGPGATGVLLAAGAGRRAGGPKALRRDADGTSWLVRSAEVLLEGGCGTVVVVLGCGRTEARELLGDAAWAGDDRLVVAEAEGWADGMSSSLQVGLEAVHEAGGQAAVIHLVDLPDVGWPVVRRLLDFAGTASSVVARAAYSGRPGHPVLIGADHLVPLIADLTQVGKPAEAGARRYLAAREPLLVECGDLAGGRDQDFPG